MSYTKPKPSQQIIRFCRLIETLAGHELNPMRTCDIAHALSIAPPEATRILQNAAAGGWVEKTPDGRWRCVQARFTCIAIAVQSGIQRARSRFDDEANQYTRSPY